MCEGYPTPEPHRGWLGAPLRCRVGPTSVAVSPLCRGRGGQQEAAVSPRHARGHPLPQQAAEEAEPEPQACPGEGPPLRPSCTPKPCPPPLPHPSHPLCIRRTVPRRMLRSRGATGTPRWVSPGRLEGCSAGVQPSPRWGELGADPPLGLLVAGRRAGWRHSGQCP